MNKAVLCPVCRGDGELKDYPEGGYTGKSPTKICHGCGGRGWVEVSDNENYNLKDLNE